MNSKLIYNAFQQLVGQHARGNYIFPDRCTQEVCNYSGVKPFIYNTPIGATTNQTSRAAVALTYSTCAVGTQLREKTDRAINETDVESVYPTMLLVPGGIKVTATPLPDDNPREKAEIIQKCLEMVHNTITITSVVIVVEQVNSCIFDNTDRLVALDGVVMSIESDLAKAFTMLLGIHPMSPIQGRQPDISSVFQRTNEAKQLEKLGLRAYLAAHIPELIDTLQSTARTAHIPRQRSHIGNSLLATPKNSNQLARLTQTASAF